MELNETIARTKERARSLREYAKPFAEAKISVATKKYIERCLERAEYNEQLAAWLTELQERREADRWISVDEALPEKEGWYLVDRKERTFSIQYFFFGTADHKPYWSGECKVYYWRPLPKAPESEDSK